MRLRIEHETIYRFNRQVALQPHRLLVTPRSSHELQLLDFSVETSPPAATEWTDDVFANRIATLIFTEPVDTLHIIMTATVDQTALAYPVFSIAVEAHSYPFSYSEDDRTDLGALRLPSAAPDALGIADWAKGFVASSPTDTLALLKDLNAGLLPAIVYRPRDEEGTQSAAETLALGSGSCRDIAALFIEAARHLGFGARAVSGYLYDPDLGAADAGSTHAWAEVYLPGAGWIAFDPTHGRIGDANLIPVAVGRYNGQIMPVTGGYTGAADDAAGMEVRVSVAAV